MNFVIDELKRTIETGTLSTVWFQPDEEQQNDLLSALSKTDGTTVGLMGHSLGGASAVALGRMRDDIQAVIDLDGTMLSERQSFTNGHYQLNDEPYTVSLLSIDNEEHHNTAGQLQDLYDNVHLQNRALDGSNTWFKGSGHMNFTDLPLFSAPLASLLGTGSIDAEDCIRQMNEIILQFFNSRLKHEGSFEPKEMYE